MIFIAKNISSQKPSEYKYWNRIKKSSSLYFHGFGLKKIYIKKWNLGQFPWIQTRGKTCKFLEAAPQKMRSDVGRVKLRSQTAFAENPLERPKNNFSKSETNKKKWLLKQREWIRTEKQCANPSHASAKYCRDREKDLQFCYVPATELGRHCNAAAPGSLKGTWIPSGEFVTIYIQNISRAKCPLYP